MNSNSIKNNIQFMQVVKRDGRVERVSFDKILKRIDILCERVKLNRINTIEVAKETINGLYDGITTEEIDHFAAVSCAEKIRDDPQYDKLAAALCISRLHKMTSNDYLEVTQQLYDNKDKFGKHNPLVTEEYLEFVKRYKDQINNTLEYIKDYDFDYFGFKTLEKAYLHRIKKTVELNKQIQTSKIMKDNNKPDPKREKIMKETLGQIVERPQHLLMRVAVGLNLNSIEGALETYKGLSNRMFIFGSPTLYNAGSKAPQLASCYLLFMPDNIEGIYDTIKEVALISKRAGGIGISMSDIRANGSIIRGTNGVSNGPIPFIQELNWTGRAVNQAGRRAGAVAIFIEPWHADIFHFCELRSNKGKEEERARDIFLGLWIPDLFMKRVEADEIWSLMCPDECPGLTSTYGNEFEKLYIKYEEEKRYKRQVKAKDLWFHILTQQIETGIPYMLYKDNINRQSNQSNIGIIRSSNLCVSGDTYILTKQGQFKIKDIVDQKYEVWNGEEFSSVRIRKTGTNKKLLKIKLSNGVELKCTPQHKFYIVGGARYQKQIETSANKLKVNDYLIKYDLPCVDLDSGNNMKYPYTHGFFCGDGTTYDNYSKTIKYPKLSLYGKKQKILNHFEYECYSINNSCKTFDLTLHKDMKEKFFVPMNQSKNTILRWFEGYCDAVGTIVKNGTNKSLQVISIEKDFLLQVKLMLQLIGIDSKVTKNQYARKTLMPDGKGELKEYDCQPNYRLLLSSNELYKLSNIGFSPKRLNFTPRKPQRDASQFVYVVEIEKLKEKEDTYCFTEPKKHMGMFNGILTGQCTEIVEYTDEAETSVCNLSSICLPRFVEKDQNNNITFNFEKLKYITELITRNLNNVIDINYYPSEKAKRSNLKHRPIGVGVQGLADVYCMMDMPFDSLEARQLNKQIFETIYFGALTMSMKLAKQYGPYETFKYNGGSPFSKGLLQFHLWGLDESQLLMGYDWKGLIENIKEYGTRNSLLTTVMPTASTSQIMSNNESIEPYTTNVYTRSTLAGEFTVINKYLMEKLIEMKLWNKRIRDELLYDKGSIQNIDCIPDDIKLLFRTAYELKTKPVVEQSIERGPFIDQSQSLNIFCEIPDFDMLTSAQFYGWRRKIKTGMYYLKTQPAVSAIKFGLDAEVILDIEKKRKRNKLKNSSKIISNDDDDDDDINEDNDTDEEEMKALREKSMFGSCESCSA